MAIREASERLLTSALAAQPGNADPEEIKLFQAMPPSPPTPMVINAKGPQSIVAYGDDRLR